MSTAQHIRDRIDRTMREISAKISQGLEGSPYPWALAYLRAHRRYPVTYSLGMYEYRMEKRDKKDNGVLIASALATGDASGLTDCMLPPGKGSPALAAFLAANQLVSCDGCRSLTRAHDMTALGTDVGPLNLCPICSEDD